MGCLILTSSVLCVVPPVVQVDLGCSCDDQFQLSGIKHRHQPRVHHLHRDGDRDRDRETQSSGLRPLAAHSPTATALTSGLRTGEENGLPRMGRICHVCGAMCMVPVALLLFADICCFS